MPASLKGKRASFEVSKIDDGTYFVVYFKCKCGYPLEHDILEGTMYCKSCDRTYKVKIDAVITQCR